MSEKANIDSIFCAAVEIESTEAREAHLQRVCGDDSELRQQVDRLLDAHFQGGSILDSPPHGLGANIDRPIAEKPGTKIGPYKLLEQFGEGGFGVVYLAEQQHPVRRRVALKVVKPGMDSREVIARFEAERQALALMDHPNIAKVFDAGMIGAASRAAPCETPQDTMAGTAQRAGPDPPAHDADRGAARLTATRGRPYFVMELIQGVPITEYCDQCVLSTRERLELFMLVCQAVQHAHQKGVIHRDLKPSNVLVAMQDGKPSPKIIDFGVAKAINQRLTEHTLATGYAQLVGTPMYMSPEQAELSPLGVDTRTDIYSLGVLLYVLLTGTTPFEKERLQSASFDELRRIIREEEPLRPSARISTLDADVASTVAERRRVDTQRLLQTVRGELDWIVMKCLEKDRNRRYETASGLAADVQRYLADEPVEACPPSAAYRLRKFIRRNKGPVVAVSLVLIALVGGVTGTTWGLLRALGERDQKEVALTIAEQNRRKATQVVDEYLTLVSESTLASDPALAPLRNQLLEAALSYYQDFVRQDPHDPALQAELVAAYMRIAYLAYTLDPESDWLTPARNAFDVMEDLIRKKPDLSTLESLQRGIGRPTGTTSYLRNPAEARRTFEKGCALWQKLVDEHPEVAGFQLDLAVFFSVIRHAETLSGHPAEARRAMRECCNLLQNLTDGSPRHPQAPAWLAIGLVNLARAEALMGRVAEAESVALDAVALSEKLAAQHPDYREILTWVQWGPAEVYEHAGRIDEAVEYYRRRLAGFEKLADDSPTVPRYRHELLYTQLALGEVLWATNQRTKAAKVYEQARTLGNGLKSEDTYGQGLLAWFFANCPDGQFRDASRALDLASKLVNQRPELGDYRFIRGAAHYRSGNWQASASDLEEAMKLPHTFMFSAARLYLPMAYWRLGDQERARRNYADATNWIEKRDLQHAEIRRLRTEAAELLGLPLSESGQSVAGIDAPPTTTVDRSQPTTHQQQKTTDD